MERVACPHCDALHAAGPVGRGEEALCVRCGSALPLPRRAHSAQHGLALAATALIAFAVSISMPLMGMSELGRATSTTIPMSAGVMWFEGDHASAAVIVLCTILAPAAYLALLLFVGIGALRPSGLPGVGAAARWANLVAPWAMPEVMLLATLVTFVKVAQLAQASPGAGMYATAGVWGLMAAARHALHLPSVWSRIVAKGAAA